MHFFVENPLFAVCHSLLLNSTILTVPSNKGMFIVLLILLIVLEMFMTVTERRSTLIQVSDPWSSSVFF